MKGCSSRNDCSRVVGENLTGGICLFGLTAVEAGFGGFDVPVAVFAPQEFVELAAGFSQLPVFDELGHVGLDGIKKAEYPAVGKSLRGQRGQGIGNAIGSTFLVKRDFVCFEIHEHETGGVPDLVGKVAVGFNAADAELHIVAGRAAGEQGEAEGVVAVLADKIKGV